jgi:2-polyprenyl-3-methyl-5-hydroxy-6-metoxy-1,4-benzoquinol methylase
MTFVQKILFVIRNRINNVLFRNKQFKTEEEFYTHLFTRNPSWNSPEPNEDESIRWKEIKIAVDSLNLNSSAQILEIGCGRGWLTKKLNSYGNVTGIEPVEPVVKYARKLFPALDFYAATPSSYLLKFPARKFDLIVSTEVLEHVEDKLTFVKEIHQLLKPGGFLVITTPRLEYYQESISAFGGDPNQPVEDWVSEDQIKDLFLKSNLKIIDKKFFFPLPNIEREVLITQLWVGRKI